MSSTVEIIIKGTDKASGAFGSANKAAGGLHGTLTQIGGGIVKAGLLGVAGTVAAVGGALALCIGPASDLNETVSKVGVVFGEQADAVLAFGKTSASALGMSTNAALAAAGTYGNLFRAMGMTEDVSADMSTSLVTLAGDLASFNNMDPTEVLDKLRAGLSGETEPLKSLGVNLNADLIAAKAMQMGLAGMSVDMADVQVKTLALAKAQASAAKALEKHGESSVEYRDALAKIEKAEGALAKAQKGKAGDLTAAAKAQASYALIMEQTSLAQGDFARTSGGLANQQRILSATTENLRGKIGTKLLPVMTTFTGLITKLFESEQFQEWLDGLIEGLGNIADTVVTVVDAFAEGGLEGGLEAMFGPETAATIMGVLDALTPVADFISANLQPILIGVGAAAAVAFGVWAASAITAAAATIAPFLPALAIMAAVGIAVGLLAAAWKGNWGGIRDTLTAVWENTLKPALETLRAWLEENLPKAMDWLANVWETVLRPALEAIWAFIRDNVLPLVISLGELGFAVLELIVRRVATAFEEKFLPNIEKVWDWLKKTAGVIGEKLQPVLEWLKDKALPPILTLFEKLGEIVQKVAGWIHDVAEAIGKLPSMPSYTGPTTEVTGGYTIPAYQKGGLVSGLLGAPQLALVHGGELIIPPGRERERIIERGGNTYQLIINSSASTENLPGDFALLQAMAGA